MRTRIQTFALIFCSLSSIKLFGQCSCVSSGSLDWSQIIWNDGDSTNNYDITTPGAQPVNVGFNISTNAIGTFSDYGVTTPYEDGPDASDHWFNNGLDLGIIFNPDTGQGQSPVFIDVTFDQEITCLVFDISDIDVSGSNRKDKVTITGNHGSVLPSLRVVSSDPTVFISNNSASAIGDTSGANNNGSADPGTNNGNIMVDFGTTPINNIRITYREISGQYDPAGRGIGIFGTFSFCPPTFLPVKLLDFTVEDKNRDCIPELKWSVVEGNFLDHYLVEFSKDGNNFGEIATVLPQESTGIKNYQLDGPGKTKGYFQLSEVSIDGSVKPLKISSYQPFCLIDQKSIVFPNPLSGEEIGWKLGALDHQKISTIEILDNYGNRIENINCYQVGQTVRAKLPELPNGLYMVVAEIQGEKYYERLSVLR